MKTYKLIKKYPGSPELGTIATTQTHGDFIINQPEFWEEIKEKDYEILSFYYKNIAGKGDNYVDPNYIWYETYEGSGRWSRGTHITSPLTTKEILRHLDFGIHSVKRLSDGEIFTKGEEIRTPLDNSYCIIYKFHLRNNRLIINSTHRYLLDAKFPGLHGHHLNLISKTKKPLFKTEDGVDIYIGDEFYWLDKSLNINNSGYSKQVGFPHITLYFSTKEAAEEYIIMNKPCGLSLKEILPIFGTYYLDNSKTALNRLTEKLKELIKNKTK